MTGPESEKVQDRFIIRQSPEILAQESLPPTPNSPEVLDGLIKNALLLIDNGDYRLAITLLRNILSRDSFYPEAIEWLGYCFHKTGDLDNACKCYSELVKIQPDEYSYSALAEVLYQMGRAEEAEEFYQSALGVIHFDSPLLFGIHKNLGNISVKTGDLENAEENYNKAYALNPHSDLLYVNYGTLELQKGNIDTALERFREAVQLNAQNDKAWVGIALIHREKGDFELAYANIEKALDLEPNNKTALKLYVDWAVAEKKFDSAIEKLEGYLFLNTEDAEISLLLTECFYRKGDFLNCRIELERTHMLAPQMREINVYRTLLDNEGV